MKEIRITWETVGIKREIGGKKQDLKDPVLH